MPPSQARVLLLRSISQAGERIPAHFAAVHARIDRCVSPLGGLPRPRSGQDRGFAGGGGLETTAGSTPASAPRIEPIIARPDLVRFRRTGVTSANSATYSRRGMARHARDVGLLVVNRRGGYRFIPGRGSMQRGRSQIRGVLSKPLRQGEAGGKSACPSSAHVDESNQADDQEGQCGWLRD